VYLCFMKEMDDRKFSHEAIEEIRIRQVMRVEAGQRPELVSEALGFHSSVIHIWIALYREGDFEAFKEKKTTGLLPRPTSFHKLLTPQMFSEVFDYSTFSPDEFVRYCSKIAKWLVPSNRSIFMICIKNGLTLTQNLSFVLNMYRFKLIQISCMAIINI
jgi:hypothetical protein